MIRYITHTHTHIYIYMYTYISMNICVIVTNPYLHIIPLPGLSFYASALIGVLVLILGTTHSSEMETRRRIVGWCKRSLHCAQIRVCRPRAETNANLRKLLNSKKGWLSSQYCILFPYVWAIPASSWHFITLTLYKMLNTEVIKQSSFDWCITASKCGEDSRQMPLLHRDLEKHTFKDLWWILAIFLVLK